MRLSVRVKPNSKSTKVEKTGENSYSVHVHAPAAEGKANAAVIEALAEHFSIPKSRVRIAVGHSTRNKLVDIG